MIAQEKNYEASNVILFNRFTQKLSGRVFCRVAGLQSVSCLFVRFRVSENLEEKGPATKYSEAKHTYPNANAESKYRHCSSRIIFPSSFHDQLTSAMMRHHGCLCYFLAQSCDAQSPEQEKQLGACSFRRMLTSCRPRRDAILRLCIFSQTTLDGSKECLQQSAA